MQPIAGNWSVDYSPCFFSYWSKIDWEGLIAWILEMNVLYPD